MKLTFQYLTGIWVLFSCFCVQANIVRLSDVSTAKKMTHIHVFYDQAKDNDSLCLFYYTNILSGNPTPGIDKAMTFYARKNKRGFYDFAFLCSQPLAYITIEKKYRVGDKQNSYALLNSHLIEKGDDITIYIKFKPEYSSNNLVEPFNMKYTFSGPSMRKYSAMDQIDSSMQNTPPNNDPPPKNKFVYELNSAVDDEIIVGLNQLELNKNIFSPSLYMQIKANIFYGQRRWAKYIGIRGYYKTIVLKKDSDSIKNFRQQYALISKRDKLAIPDDVLFRSDFYAQAEIMKLQIDDLIAFGQIDLTRILSVIKNSYSGLARDKLLAAYFQFQGEKTVDYSESLNSTIKILKSHYAINILNKLKDRLNGTVAYNFILPDKNGKLTNLNDLKGKVIFVDFWFTGCAHCKSYFEQEVSKAEQYFKGDSNIVFISISIDKNKEMWEKSLKSGLYTSESALNLYTGGKGDQAPVIQKYSVRSYPHPLLVGRNGVLLKFGDEGLRNENGISPLIKTLQAAETGLLN